MLVFNTMHAKLTVVHLYGKQSYYIFPWTLSLLFRWGFEAPWVSFAEFLILENLWEVQLVICSVFLSLLDPEIQVLPWPPAGLPTQSQLAAGAVGHKCGCIMCMQGGSSAAGFFLSYQNLTSKAAFLIAWGDCMCLSLQVPNTCLNNGSRN